MRLKARSKVDFPQPEGPMMAVILLRSTFILTPVTALKVP